MSAGSRGLRALIPMRRRRADRFEALCQTKNRVTMLLERIQDYLDYDAIARDLSLDYSETTHRRNATGLPLRIGSPPGNTAARHRAGPLT